MTAQKQPFSTKILLLIIVVIVAVYFELDTEKRTDVNRKQNLEYAFQDTVQNIFYDVKGIPEITIAGKDYYLSAGYKF